MKRDQGAGGGLGRPALRDRNTVKQVAAYWGCSTKTVYRMIKSGELECLRLGGLLRVSREQVEAYEGSGAAGPITVAAAGPITFARARATNDAYELGRLIAGRELRQRQTVHRQPDQAANAAVGRERDLGALITPK
jgi:excisionase family DNA binding protein